jgi:predicted GNAT family acetyltransferase
MSDLPEKLFKNPVWHALRTTHCRFAALAGNACRYPADVAPFAAIAAPDRSAFEAFRSLLLPGESVWVIGDRYPSMPELTCEETLECLQMVLPREVEPPDPALEIVQLSQANAQEMVTLTDLAFPGFFRVRTCEMGTYYGVRANGDLIAMGGERLMVQDYAEISGVCTHPAHRGRGLAAGLIWQLVRDHRRDSRVSWLHVGAANRRAIELYCRMGFKVVRQVSVNRISRKD